MRTWQVIEWSCDSFSWTHNQLIEISDKVGLQMTCPTKLCVILQVNTHVVQPVVLPTVPMTDN